jgi:hypothetical protein
MSNSYSFSSKLSSVVNNLSETNPKAASGAFYKKIWEEIANEEDYKHTGNISVRESNEKKEMVIYTDSSLYAADLNARSELFLLQIKTNPHGRDIEKLTFKPSKKNFDMQKNKEEVAISWYDEYKVPSIPLSEKEKEELLKGTENIENEQLRKKVCSAMIKDIEWKKGIEAAKIAQNGSERP